MWTSQSKWSLKLVFVILQPKIKLDQKPKGSNCFSWIFIKKNPWNLSLCNIILNWCRQSKESQKSLKTQFTEGKVESIIIYKWTIYEGNIVLGNESLASHQLRKISRTPQLKQLFITMQSLPNSSLGFYSLLDLSYVCYCRCNRKYLMKRNKVIHEMNKVWH